MTLVNGPSCIYIAKGNKTNEFYGGRVWGWALQRLAPIPAGPSRKQPHRGCCGTDDGERFVYMVKGSRTSEFWRYDIVTDTWQQLPDVPGKAVRAGADVLHVKRGNAGGVYLLKGNTREFFRYDVTTARWNSLPEPPVGNGRKWPDGSWLVYDDQRNIYAHKARYHEFYSFDVVRDSWNPVTLKPMPVVGPGGARKSGAGSCGAWHETKLYALKGGNTLELWGYVPARDSWFEMEKMPPHGRTGKKKKVGNGASMVSYEGGNVPVILFVLKGSKTNEFWMYEAVYPGAGQGDCAAGAMADSWTCSTQAACMVVPNPIYAGRFTVTMTPCTSGPARLSILDALGRCRLSMPVDACRPIGLDAGSLGLGPGVYLVRLDAPGRSASAKFVTTR